MVAGGRLEERKRVTVAMGGVWWGWVGGGSGRILPAQPAGTNKRP